MNANRWRGRASRRPGFGLAEMAVTGVLIAASMAATAQVIGWIAQERRAVERRERAVLEASNLIERITGLGWSELTPELMSQIHLSESTAAYLPGSILDVQLTPSEDVPVRRKVQVAIRWRDRTGRPESPVRLVTWIYRREEESR